MQTVAVALIFAEFPSKYKSLKYAISINRAIDKTKRKYVYNIYDLINVKREASTPLRITK